jgi:hypothetical protein
VEKALYDLVLSAKARILRVPSRVAPELLRLDSRVVAQSIFDRIIPGRRSLLWKKERNESR